MKANDLTQLMDDWPRPQDFRRSIRVEFALYTTGLFLALIGASSYFTTVQSVDLATRAMAESLVVQARAFSGPAAKHLLAGDEPDALLLNDICIKLAGDNPDVFWAGIAGSDDVFLAHTDMKAVISGTTLDLDIKSQPGDYLRDGETFAILGDTVFLTSPIVVSGVHIGRLGLAASTRQIQAARKNAIVASMWIALALVLLGVPAAVMILQRKIRPVSLITESLQKVNLEDLKIDIPIKSNNEFGYLAATLRAMGDKLSVAQGMVIERERISRELEIARDIQMSMLPRSFPSGRNFQIAGSYTSALEVGGDYYDFLPLSENRLGILVADVSGKSLPGMLVMLMTRDIVKSVYREEEAPDRLLARVNRELLSHIHQDMFVTMFYGVLDLNTGTLQFASAGHNALVWLRGNGTESELIRPSGYPLGMMPAPVFDKRIKAAEIRLSEGDWIVQYTDGVNEALNEREEEFGMERFKDALLASSNRDADQLTSDFMKVHREFVGNAEQYDDITLLAIKWTTRKAESDKEGKEQPIRVATN